MNQPLKHRNVSFREGKNKNANMTKFIYSEKATKFCDISTLLLSYVVPVKNKAKISQNFVAFSEYMNFMYHDILQGSTEGRFLKLGRTY